MSHKDYTWWSDKKKLEAVTTYLIFGKAALVAASTGVSEGTIRRWMIEPWWKEMVESIQADSDQALDSKLEARLGKVLDLVQDRLDNGDFMFNPKEGVFVRRPVALKDGWKVGREMFDVRQILRKHKPEQVSQEGVADILKGLAQEFAQMARTKVKEKLDGQVEKSPDSTKTEILTCPDGIMRMPTGNQKHVLCVEQNSNQNQDITNSVVPNVKESGNILLEKGVQKISTD